MELNGAKILYTIHTNIPLLGDFKITQTLVSTWIVMALLSGFAIWLGHDLKLENVSKRQAAAEFIVTRLEQFVHDNMGFHFDQYIPLVGAIFALSIGCNLISVVGLWSPTADLNTEAAWAIVVFVLIIMITHITEIPCAVLGDMLNNVQQLIYAIAFKNGSLRGTIPKKIKEDCALCATGMFAASVGIRLKSNELCDIHRETPLTTTLRDFNHLFMAANDKDRLREFLSTQNPRVAVKYRALLQSLLTSKTGIKINNASPNNETFIKHFSTKELSSNLILINSEIEEIVEPITVCGRLVGANVERCSFEFITVSNESIKGQLTPALSSSVFSVPQSVEADIEIRIGSDSMTREEKLLYTLTAIRPIVPQSETEI